MANYTPQEVIDYVKPFVANIPVTAIDSQTVDIVHSMVWRYYPWRWSLASLTAISLVDGTQDYSLGGSDLAGFYRLVRVRITRTDTTPDQYNDNTVVLNWLPPDLTPIDPMALGSVCWEPTLSKIRLQRAAAVAAGATYTINGEAQTIPTKITDSGLNTSFTMPDIYFGVLCDGVLMRMYQLANDSRAGSMNVRSDGTRVYTGQMGAFYDQLFAMAEAEDALQGAQRWPSESFATGVGNGIGLFGYS